MIYAQFSSTKLNKSLEVSWQVSTQAQNQTWRLSEASYFTSHVAKSCPESWSLTVVADHPWPPVSLQHKLYQSNLKFLWSLLREALLTFTNDLGYHPVFLRCHGAQTSPRAIPRKCGLTVPKGSTYIKALVPCHQAVTARKLFIRLTGAKRRAEQRKKSGRKLRQGHASNRTLVLQSCHWGERDRKTKWGGKDRMTQEEQTVQGLSAHCAGDRLW